VINTFAYAIDQHGNKRKLSPKEERIIRKILKRLRNGGNKMTAPINAKGLVGEFCNVLMQGIRSIQEDGLDQGDGTYEQMVAGYLESDLDNLCIESKSFPGYKRNLMMIALHYVIEEKYAGGGLSFSINEYEDTQIPPRYMTVTVTPGKEEKCLYSGFQQMVDGDDKFVVEVDCTCKTPFFNVIAHRDNSDVARAFIKEVEEFINTRNVYKGQVVQIDSSGYLDFMETPDRTWDDVIIPDDIRDELIYNAIWPIEKSELFAKNGIPTKRGIMLEGKPGVGKTMAVSVIANTMRGKATTIWIPARSVSNADDIATIYECARELAPSILLFEDIDMIATDRAVMGNYSPVLGELLGQLDGLSNNDTIITVATTNYPEAIEKALRDRPSRFDRRIQFELPDVKARKKMLVNFTDKINLGEDVDFDDLAEATEDFTGAYMRELVATAVIECIKEDPDAEEIVVCSKHFKSAIDKFKTKGKKFGFTGI
jgi:AAA+ superfamily predicted ATPase